MKYTCLLTFLIVLFGCQTKNNTNPSWALILHLPDTTEIEVAVLPKNLADPFVFEKTISNIQVKLELVPKTEYTSFKATAAPGNGEAQCYLSLRYNYKNGNPWNFNGQVIKSDVYRQSPHDVNAWIVTDIAEQGMPMVALANDGSFIGAVCSSPAFYNNYTSQEYNLEKKYISICSGDNGAGTRPDTSKIVNMNYNAEKTQKFSPGVVKKYFQRASVADPHVFEGVLFNSKTHNLSGLRKDVNKFVADHFGQGKYPDYFGSLAFSTAYMNLRVNETGKSKFWVVPSVEYANTQYCRDAFWISTMLSPEMDAQCLKSELDSVNHYAEYPLFVVIWAYRNKMQGIDVDLGKVQKYVDAIEKHVKDGYFHSYDENDGRLDFQFWGDMVAFEKSDVITYNQGLYALQLLCSEKMGLKTSTKSETAVNNYRNMFLQKEGYFPLSKLKKGILSPDPLVADLLAQILFNQPLLDKKQVEQHYRMVVEHSKTPYGYKIYCAPDGSYLPYQAFDSQNYLSQIHREKIDTGAYHHGGSWMLYDMLFLLNAQMHGIETASDELIWRLGIDFKIGGTTFEVINTVTGEPWKPNMGWNVAVYSFLKTLSDSGKIDKRILESVNNIKMN